MDNAFSPQEKANLLECYFRNGIEDDNGQWNFSVATCMRDFLRHNPNRQGISYQQVYQMIRLMVPNFRETGSLEKKKTGRLQSVRTPEKIEEVRNVMENEPSTSIRRLQQRAQIGYGTCQRILKKDIGMFPYKVRVVQELKPLDYGNRMAYCEWFQQNMNDDTLDLTFFSDEAWVHLDGYINSQNTRVWSTENPFQTREVGLHPQKIGIWIAISRRRLYGPVFFQENVNAAFYRQEILTPFINQLDPEELQQGLFQQDGATAHTARDTIRFLQEFYDPDKLISCNRWPSRSPDLTPLDYFVFGHLKNTVFRNPIPDIAALQQAIIEVCNSITPQMLVNVFDNMKKRVRLCLEHEGGQFEQFL